MAKKDDNVKVAATTVDVNAEYARLPIPERFKDSPETFAVAGLCRMESYKDRDDVKQSRVTCRLLDPFNDDDFKNVEITPKWSNSGGLFKYRAKKKLREISELTFPVYITPVTFYSKRLKSELTVASLFMPNLFADGFIEFEIKPGFQGAPSEDLAVFRSLVAERWGWTAEETPMSAGDGND